MPFQPNKITKKHVLDAIKKIEQENVELNTSTGYDVIINGKSYPPKEVMRYAHEQMNGENIWRRTGGDPTNKYLELLGFKIVKKDDDPYSWVEAHEKIAIWLLDYENRQVELINTLKEIGATVFKDKDKLGNEIDLQEIDPFSFFCYLYKYGSEKRLESLRSLCSKLNIQPLPTGDKGIPSVNAQSVWLFSYGNVRKENDVKTLWKLFFAAMNDAIDNQLFSDVLAIKNTAKTKLTESLFMVAPEKYLPLNAQTRPYLQKEFEIDTKFNSYSEYLNILDQVKDYQDESFPVISHEAFIWNSKNNKISYWVFQGNPDVFDFQTAIREELLNDWTVTAHKDKIKVGDKVIFWITGKNAGCYALGEVTEEPRIVEAPDDAHLWKKEDKNQLKAGIKITHNLIDKPVSLIEIKDNERLSQLKVGNQGTNFTATEEEYNALLELIENTDEVKYWGFSPGEGAKHWEEFYEKGIMALGWEELGDFSKFGSKEEVAHRLRELESTDSSKKNDALSCYDFVHKMSIGDIIFVKKGRSSLLGYGIVKSDYYYDTNRQYYKNCRKVEWKKKGNWEVEHGIAIKTLTDITPFKESIQRYKNIMGIDGESEMSTDNRPKSNQPKNIILYGPPGTGKTYHSIDKAVEIATGSSLPTHKENKARFDQLREEGQIEFVTFHQNYSYEDFMIGLRPDIDFEQLRFKQHRGIFYELAKRARDNYYASKKNIGLSKSFDDAFATIIKPLVEENKGVKVKMTSGVSFEIIDITDYSIHFKKPSGGTQHTLSIQTLREVVEDQRKVTSGLSVYYYPLVRDIQELMKPETGIKAETLKNFVLVIDEVNRANISKVFGELITLLEDDKRIGEENELRITLPNGEKDFGLPPNLYVIGTMNTADRSIALIDIALRRRFDFIGKYPEYDNDKLSGEDAKFLESINKAIYDLKKSPDYLIGHAYFMKNEATEGVIRNKVIPLLLEYFSGKLDIVEKVFKDSGYTAKYDSQTFKWVISKG